MADCHYCSGTGKFQDAQCAGTGLSGICPECNGSGQNMFNLTCGTCNGKGKLKCSDCNGSGKMTCPGCHGSGKE